MKPSLSLKTLLRTPIKTLLIVLLLAGAAFLIFARIGEYAVITRETQRAIIQYQGIFTLDTGMPDTSELGKGSQIKDYGPQFFGLPALPELELTQMQIDAFSALPQVTATEIRYMTAGISDSYNRIDMLRGPYFEPYNYTARFIVEATFENYAEHTLPAVGLPARYLNFSDCKLLAGDSSFLSDGGNLHLNLMRDEAFAEAAGKSAYFLAWNSLGREAMSMMSSDYTPAGQSFADSLREGGRYLLIGRWEPLSPAKFPMLGDLDTADYADPVVFLDDQPENYLNTEEFATVRKLIEITNSDLRTYDMVYVSNMMAIQRFAEAKMVITEGRALTQDDLGKNVCVVNQTFLGTNKVALGDKITMGLGGKLLEQHGAKGAVAVIPERYEPPVSTAELEIVGVYLDTDTPNERKAAQYWNYSVSTVFVPSSLLPVEPPADHQIMPGEISFLIEDATQIEEFLEVAESLAEELGVAIKLYDGGWLDVSESFKGNTQISFTTTVISVCAAIMALLLSVYLFIGRKKQMYAVMRALGTPRGAAKRSLLLPFGALAAVALLAGGIIGTLSTAKSVSTALNDMAAITAADYIPDAALSGVAIAACAVSIVIILAASSAFTLSSFEKTPTLILLHGNVPAAVKRKTSVARTLPALPVSAKVSLPDTGVCVPPRRKYGAVRHTLCYILRHMRRTARRTILCILLSTFLFGGIGLLAVTQLSYEDTVHNIEVKALTTGLSSESVMELVSSDLIRNPFYRGTLSVICNDIEYATYNMVLSNDLERVLHGTDTVEYAQGYDASFVSEDQAQCVLGSGLAEELGVSIGDQIKLLSSGRLLELMRNYELKELERRIILNGVPFTVVGIVSSKDTSTNKSIYAAVGEAVEKANEGRFAVEQGEFVLSDNYHHEELRTYIQSLVDQSVRYALPADFTMDTEALENVLRILNLMRKLLPIAVIAAVLIGFVVSGGIILQSAKEAAICRILGTANRRVRCMLAMEQISLCIIGLTAATAGLMLYSADRLLRVRETLLWCSGIYLLGYVIAAILASILVTRKRILGLLQTKE